jgi:hypothetical protein
VASAAAAAALSGRAVGHYEPTGVSWHGRPNDGRNPSSELIMQLGASGDRPRTACSNGDSPYSGFVYINTQPEGLI